MCTLALFFRELEDYPLVVAANRDEFFTRPSAPPQLLAQEPVIQGGRDLLAGGTWLGVSERGMLAGILNRRLEQRRAGETRSRGLLCLDILAAKDPAAACDLLTRQNGFDYQPFNLLFANENEARVAYDRGEKIQWRRLEKGLHVLGNSSVYDPMTEKMERAYQLFSEAGALLRQKADDPPSWISALRSVLSDHVANQGADNPKGAICVHAEPYGTVSSTILYYSRRERSFFSYHASGPPCREAFHESLSLKVL